MKNYLLSLITLMLLCFSCQKETITDQQEPSSFFKIRHLSNNDIKTNNNLTRKLSTFQAKGNKNNELSREVYNAEYDFYIETDSVKYMESDDGRFHSYTFPIVKDSTETSLRNLVLYSYDNSDYDATLLTYDLTESQMEELEANDHISSSYYVHSEDLDANFGDVMSAAPPCEPYVLTFHTTPDTNETFLFTQDSVCQHNEPNEESCDVFTIVLIDCNVPGGPSGSEGSQGDEGTDVTWEYGSGSSNNGDDVPDYKFVTGSSPKAPLFTKKFLTYLNSLPQEQQDFLNSSLENFNLKIKLQNFLNVNGYTDNNDSIIRDIIEFFRETDWKGQLRQAVATGITSTAEITHLIYKKLSAIAQEYPSSIGFINLFVDEFRVIASEVFDTNPQTIEWLDLFGIWLFELGDFPNQSNLFDGMDTIYFDGNDSTTESLKLQEGVQEARNQAILNIQNDNIADPVLSGWVYGQGEFYDGMENGNIATSFLGSYITRVDITQNLNGSHTLTFTVSNPSTWDSASRLRIDNDNDENHDGIFPNTFRENQHDPNNPNIEINLGGNIKQVWIWTEIVN